MGSPLPKSGSKISKNGVSQLLEELPIKCKHYSFYNIVTSNKSWICVSYGPNGSWLIPEQYNPEFDGTKN